MSVQPVLIYSLCVAFASNNITFSLIVSSFELE